MSIFFKKMSHPRPLFDLFSSFQKFQLLQQINVKNVVTIQFAALGFEPTTFGTRVSSYNH